MNQCDGCKAKMPLEDGVHVHDGGRPYMVCTAGRYDERCLHCGLKVHNCICREEYP